MKQTSVDSKKEDIEICLVTMEQRDNERGHFEIKTGYEENLVPDLIICEAQEGTLLPNDMYKSKNGEIKQFAKGSYQELQERKNKELKLRKQTNKIHSEEERA